MAVARVKVASERMGNWPELGQTSWLARAWSDQVVTAWPEPESTGHSLATLKSWPDHWPHVLETVRALVTPKSLAR